MIEDDDFVLTESRAILQYLASQYDTTGMLYPQDLKTKARIDLRLHFDMGTFYAALQDAVVSVRIYIDSSSCHDLFF